MKTKIHPSYLLPLLVLLLSSCLGLTRPEEEEKRVSDDHLMIKEVFSSGTYTPDVKWGSGFVGPASYDYDKYIIIYNPTSKVIYLDSLCIARTAFQMDLAIDLKGDEEFTETHCPVDNIMMFPGSGHDYPINPGEEKVLTAVAINHTLSREEMMKKYTFVSESFFIGGTSTENKKACDLSGADFEWLTPSQMRNNYFYYLEDTNTVPNLIPVFAGFQYNNPECEGQFDVPENRTLLLVKLGVPRTDLDQEAYWWDYETGHENSFHSLETPHHKAHVKGDAHCVKLPNEWVIDAVSICPQKNYKRTRVSKEIDAGYNSVREGRESDAQQGSWRGYSLQRKYNGERFQDTNNSTTDFEKQAATLLTIPPKKLYNPNVTLVDGHSYRMTVGQKEFFIRAKVSPRNAKETAVTWTSSDPSIAEVKGTPTKPRTGISAAWITGLKPGTVTITASLANGAEDVCTLVVEAPKE